VAKRDSRIDIHCAPRWYPAGEQRHQSQNRWSRRDRRWIVRRDADQIAIARRDLRPAMLQDPGSSPQPLSASLRRRSFRGYLRRSRRPPSAPPIPLMRRPTEYAIRAYNPIAASANAITAKDWRDRGVLPQLTMQRVHEIAIESHVRFQRHKLFERHIGIDLLYLGPNCARQCRRHPRSNQTYCM
jgi:hypothetical protein